MKTSLVFFILAASVSFSSACTKQGSKQPSVNSTESDARHDISNQPGTLATPDNDGKEPITTNPNSARAGEESTLNTSQGAAVVGDANLNPRTEGAAGKTPTSVDADKSTEPKTDAEVRQVNCLDAEPGVDCLPSSQSPLNSGEVPPKAPQK